MKYESYKDSGVDWIGKVPSHWEVAAFKRKITINNGKDYKDFLDEEIYPVMGSGGHSGKGPHSAGGHSRCG